MSGFAFPTEFFELLQARHMPTRRMPSAIQRPSFGASRFSRKTVQEEVDYGDGGDGDMQTFAFSAGNGTTLPLGGLTMVSILAARRCKASAFSSA